MTLLKFFAFAAASISAALALGSFTWTPSGHHISTCDHSAYAYLSSVTPANWRDCVALLSEWGGENGSFTITQTNTDVCIPILISDSCTLALKPNVEGEGPYKIGDVDVGGILETACRDYTNGTALAVQGDVSCDAGGGRKKGLHWVLFDSKI